MSFPSSRRARRAWTTSLLSLTVIAGVAAAGAQPPAAAPAAAGILIVNPLVVDGAGAARRNAAVRVRGDRITEVGTLTAAAGEQVVDAKGLVLAPGFIDTHSHGDRGVLEHPDALAAVSQGITTIVGGQDGGSPFPLADHFAKVEQQRAAINVASYAGHGVFRRKVMGEDFRRHARPEEVARMREMLEQELR